MLKGFYSKNIPIDLGEKGSLRNNLYKAVKKNKKVFIRLEKTKDSTKQEEVNQKNKKLLDEVEYLKKFDILKSEFIILDSAYLLTYIKGENSGRK